jgi:paraquat-inducible protein A
MSLRHGLLAALALLYAAGAGLLSWQVIARSEASTHAVDRILDLHDLQNEGAVFLDRFSRKHPILGTLFAPSIEGALKLPPSEEAEQALHSEVPRLLKTAGREASAAAWWSWGLLNFSLLYVAGLMLWERSFTARPVLFALVAVSLACFVVGVLAPAMIVWTGPSVPTDAGKVGFILQHQVRGIATIIHRLFTSGHWVVGGFIFLFSIVTPLAKALLGFFVSLSRSKALNQRIGQLLHAISKWSMADVFVAGLLLSLYAVKAQQATKSMACIGLYYFLGYCILSLVAGELLVHSGATDPRERKEKRFGPRTGAAVAAAALACVAGASLYTQTLYPWHEPAKSPITENLKDSRLFKPLRPGSLDGEKKP